MISGSSYIPREKLGALQSDDARFICAEMKTIGVADGVGGWSKHGVDAGEYAAVNGDPNSKLDPRKVLNDAYSKTKVQGSSTACILTPDQDEVTTLPGEAGDVIVAGTDGLFDNLYPWQKEELVRTKIEGGSDPQDDKLTINRGCKPKKYTTENIRTPPFGNPVFTFFYHNLKLDILNSDLTDNVGGMIHRTSRQPIA